MNPYRHEFQHFLRTKTVIAVVIVGVIAGGLGFFSVSNASSSVSISGAGFWYDSGGAYHVDLWVFDNAGNPVSGVRVDLVISTLYTGIPPPPTVLLNQTLSSDSQGRVQFSVPLALGNYSAGVTAVYPAVPGSTVSGALGSGFELQPAPAGTLNVLGTPFTYVARNFYTVDDEYLLIWAGPNATVPTGDQVISCSFTTNVSNISTPFPTNCTGESNVSTVLLGPVSGYRTSLPIPSVPSASFNYPEENFTFIEIRNATGAVLYSMGLGTGCLGFCNGPVPVGGSGYFPGALTPGPGVVSSSAAELSFFLPLMALMATYWSYARPRLTGTLEPVLVRPVTRRGLFLVRYGTVALALAVAAVAEVLLLDLGTTSILHEPLPVGFLAPLAGGILVAGLGFAGLIFLAAHAFRSTGPVLGVGVALLLVLSLFWLEVLFLVGYLVELGNTANLGPLLTENLLLRSQLLAPPQFPNLATVLLTGFSNFGNTGGNVAAAAGITAPLTATVAVLWIVVPFLVTSWRVATRD